MRIIRSGGALKRLPVTELYRTASQSTNTLGDFRTLVLFAGIVGFTNVGVRFSPWPLGVFLVVFQILTLSAYAVLASRIALTGATSLGDLLLKKEALKRVAAYALDGTLIALPCVALLVFAAKTLRAAETELLYHSGTALALQTGGVAAFLICALVALPAACRLSLKLPTRAVGVRLGWKQAWQLGRGNTLRLLVLAASPLAAAVVLSSLMHRFVPLGSFDAIDGLFAALATRLGASVTAHAYLFLTEGHPADAAAGQGSPPTAELAR